MTYQQQNLIEVNGEVLDTYADPLAALPKEWNLTTDVNTGHSVPLFRVMSTGCWRGYVATWRIEDGVLWLVGIDGKNQSGKSLGMTDVFHLPRLPAFWFSGAVECGVGETVSFNYQHFYEKTVRFEFERGCLVRRSVTDNPIEEYRQRAREFNKHLE